MEMQSLSLSWTFILVGNPNLCVCKRQTYEPCNFSNLKLLIRLNLFSVMEVQKTKLDSITINFQKEK